MAKNIKYINLWGGITYLLSPSFLPPPQYRNIKMASLFEMAEDIIDKRGGEAYKRAWLERWLTDPKNEDEFLALLLKKELAEAAKKKKDTSKPKKIKL